MADVLKANLDERGAGAAAASAAAATLRSSSSGLDAGTPPFYRSHVSLAALGRDTQALCRVVKADQKLSGRPSSCTGSWGRPETRWLWEWRTLYEWKLVTGMVPQAKFKKCSSSPTLRCLTLEISGNRVFTSVAPSLWRHHRPLGGHQRSKLAPVGRRLPAMTPGQL